MVEEKRLTRAPIPVENLCTVLRRKVGIRVSGYQESSFDR
jgi:hypothetical protein